VAAGTDGFNEGWITFQDHGANAIRGCIDADAVIASFIATPQA